MESCFYTAQGELLCNARVVEKFDSSATPNQKSFSIPDVVSKLLKDKNNCGLTINAIGGDVKNIDAIPCHLRTSEQQM